MKFERLNGLNDEARAGLSDALGDERDEATLREQIQAGRAELWRLNDGESYMITRLEPPTLVICAYQGKDVAGVVPRLMQAAKANGCDTLRFHTLRKGMERLLKQFEPTPTEYVYRINVQ